MVTRKKKRTPKILISFVNVWLLTTVLQLIGCTAVESNKLSTEDSGFSFEVAADMRQFAGPQYQSSRYFMGTCEAIRDIGKGAFMVSPGDIDSPWHVYDMVRKILGSNYTWYPVVGNHEAETPEDMEWLRWWGRKGIPYLIRKGPENGKETTYSFDFENAHFVVINQYYDGLSDTTCKPPSCKDGDGDICDCLYKWLRDDLKANSKPFVFVFGHEPIIPMPDDDNGRYRHITDSLNAHPENSHRFQQLLRKHKVTAYFCGHTHNFSFTKINGLWQLDAGHCRGVGDKGARSTFLKIWVDESSCRADVYRDDGNGGLYSLVRTVVLK